MFDDGVLANPQAQADELDERKAMTGTIDRRGLTFKALGGLSGGFLGWIPVEMASHGHTLTQAQTGWGLFFSYLSMALFAGLVGGMIVASEAQTLELTPRVKRGFLQGFIVCFVLSLPATYYSNMVFGYVLNAGGWSINHSGSVGALVAARVLGWALMGMMLGAGVGAATVSLRNVVKGACGGWIGGFAGGLFFDFISHLTNGGLTARLVGLCGVGMAIGLIIGIVHELTKNAWLTVEAGRLKGRQFRLEHAANTVGKAEENSVGLFGDPLVQPRHAVITHEGSTYSIRSLAVQAGTIVNGTRIETQLLHDGDRIQIGGYELGFHLKPAPGTSAQQTSTASALPVPPAKAPAERPVAEAEVSGKTACLVNDAGEAFYLQHAAPTRLGRALDNDIVVNHATVSRYHATIGSVDGGYEVRDLGSRNGVFVGGQRVSAARLANGDSVSLGEAQFTFRG